MSVDWNAEVNAVRNEAQVTLAEALAIADLWDDVIIIWGAGTRDDGYSLHYERNDSMTDERMLWMLVSIQHQFLKDSEVRE